MSWDAHLDDDRGHEELWINYTHNTNGMIRAAATAAGVGAIEWWTGFNGLSGPAGAAFLDCVIREMENDLERYRAMNPPNGWGDCDSLLEVLRKMRDAVPEWPTEWSVHG